MENKPKYKIGDCVVYQVGSDPTGGKMYEIASIDGGHFNQVWYYNLKGSHRYSIIEKDILYKVD